MEIRLATVHDADVIMRIYSSARVFMAEQGNKTQWNNGYPNETVVANDIQDIHSYVCIESEKVVGVFAFIIGEDATYRIIEQGSWHSDAPYGTIHRLAGSRDVKGVAQACFDFCKGRIDYLRIDTHMDNKPMQGAILKNGFVECGIIYVADGTSRIAFDYSK